MSEMEKNITQYLFEALQEQRNAAMDAAAQMKAQLDMAQAEIEKLKAQLEEPEDDTT